MVCKFLDGFFVMLFFIDMAFSTCFFDCLFARLKEILFMEKLQWGNYGYLSAQKDNFEECLYSNFNYLHMN